MSIPYRVTPTSITLVLNGVTHILTEDSHPNYSKVREAIKAKEFDSLEALIDIPRAVEQYGKGMIKVVDGRVYYGDHELHGTMTKRLVSMMDEGFDVDPLAAFIENLMQNPSKRAVDELYDFLEACDLPITEDGHFVAYKKVRGDYKDIYTGKIDNSVGAKPSMPRNMVDEEKSRTCSQGLHFCSQSYLPHYSGASDDRVMLVKINPRDVVAIPADYQNAKGRCCLYEVIGEVDKSNLKFYDSTVYQAPASEWADVYEEDDDGLMDDADEVSQTIDPNVAAHPACTATPIPENNEPMTVKAARYGYVKNGLVPVTYDDELTVHTHDDIPEGAVMRSYETKSVRKAVKEAVEKIEAALAQPVEETRTYVIHFVDEYGLETHEVDIVGLEAAKQYAKDAMDEDEHLYGVTIYDGETDLVVKDYTNDNYVSPDSSSSEWYEDSSSEDLEDEPAPAVEPKTVLVANTAWPFPTGNVVQKPQGAVFTKAQAAAIMGISLDKLEQELASGTSTRVELAGDWVRFKI